MNGSPLDEFLERLEQCEPDERFTLDTPILDFIKIVEKEMDIPASIRNQCRRRKRNPFDTVYHLVLSHVSPTINWGSKNYGVLDGILKHYGFLGLAPKSRLYCKARSQQMQSIYSRHNLVRNNK